MEERYTLPGPNLWTRDVARPHREEVEHRLEQLAPGDTLVIDCGDVEVFDYSFAAELFGRTMLSLPVQHPSRFLAVAGLAPYARENLVITLERLELIMIELAADQAQLIGKTHPADVATFAAITTSAAGLSAADLSAALGVTINAMNERLGKLVDLGVVRREQALSPAGRKQFRYRTLS